MRSGHTSMSTQLTWVFPSNQRPGLGETEAPEGREGAQRRKRKEPSELSEEGDKKRRSESAGTRRDKTGSSAKRLKKDKLWRAAGL